MSEPNDQDAFLARCRRTADAARSAGLVLAKAPAGRQALEVSRDGRSVEFPIVSDELDWHRTTVEEALYAVLLDALGSAGARVDDTAAATLDEADRAMLPAIERELRAARARYAQLADLVGGQPGLDALLATVESPAV